MLGFLDWLRMGDPTQRAVGKYARAVVKFHRRYPDRPLQECVPWLARKVLRKLLHEGTYERERLESLIAADVPCHDPVEFCCRLATFETGLKPDDGQAYLDQAERIEAELSRIGFHERSPWLDKLRPTILAIRAPSSAPAGAEFSGDSLASDKNRLIVPRHPKLGSWIGFTLFASIGLTCGWFGHTLAALVLILIGTLSLLSTVVYWEIDKARGRLWFKSGNALSGGRQHMGYPAGEIVGVNLETRNDSEGGEQYSVRVIFQRGQRIVVSDQFRDADRIATFLGVEKIATKR
jgi:hypothetical protein